MYTVSRLLQKKFTRNSSCSFWISQFYFNLFLFNNNMLLKDKHERINFLFLTILGKLHFCFFALVFGILFQCGLLSIFLLWKPSYDDPQMFLATAFIWGCTAAVWDFAILSESLKNFFIMVFLKSVFIVSNVFLAF